MHKQTNFVKTQVRIPAELHQRIKTYAEDETLSMNSAVLKLLEFALEQQSLKSDKQKPMPEAVQNIFNMINLAVEEAKKNQA